MKRIVAVLMVLVLATSSLFAQETLSEVVKDYQRNNSEFTLVIPSFLIKVGLAFGDIEEEEREILELIDDMKIVICENRFHNNDFLALEEGIKNGNFAEVMTIQERNEKIRMIMNQKSKRKSELLMLVESDDESILMLFDFRGEPDFSKFLSLVD
ncbi:MAG: DUF4252 domain-containing protein [Bacteroidales bacterium]|nr:DUF4252 domain-containing protein [Bacteroidales bacterium]